MSPKTLITIDLTSSSLIAATTGPAARLARLLLTRKLALPPRSNVLSELLRVRDVERDKEEGARGDSGVTGSSSVPEYRALRVRERGMPRESTRRHGGVDFGDPQVTKLDEFKVGFAFGRSAHHPKLHNVQLMLVTYLRVDML